MASKCLSCDADISEEQAYEVGMCGFCRKLLAVPDVPNKSTVSACVLRPVPRAETHSEGLILEALKA